MWQISELGQEVLSYFIVAAGGDLDVEQSEKPAAPGCGSAEGGLTGFLWGGNVMTAGRRPARLVGSARSLLNKVLKRTTGVSSPLPPQLWHQILELRLKVSSWFSDGVHVLSSSSGTLLAWRFNNSAVTPWTLDSMRWWGHVLICPGGAAVLQLCLPESHCAGAQNRTVTSGTRLVRQVSWSSRLFFKGCKLPKVLWPIC